MQVKLFLDCDGVLADFDKRFFELAGEPSRGFEDKYGAKEFWKIIAKDENFFENLDLLPGAQELYDAVKHLNPPILTGIPHGDWAQPQKLRWRDKHFPEAEMICCPSRDKFKHMEEGKLNVIIDDWAKHQHIWENNEGIFILHTSVEESLDQLRQMELI